MTIKKKSYTKNDVALMYITAQAKLNQQIALNWELQLKNEELIQKMKDLHDNYAKSKKIFYDMKAFLTT